MMPIRFLFLVSTALIMMLAAPALAQQMTFGGGTDGLDRRESTWLAYFDSKSKHFVGGFAINYNKVTWQPSYASQLDTILRGSIW